MTITLRNTKGSALTYAELDANFSDLDARTTEAWQNLRGQIDITGIINPPTKATYKSYFQVYSFAAGSPNECTVLFHMPHDYVDGTAIIPHGHLVSPTASVGNIRWTYDIVYANEFEIGDPGVPVAVQKFGTPVSFTVDTAMVADYQDAQLIAMPPAELSIPTLEHDSVIMMRVQRDGGAVEDTYADPIYLLYIDLYYRSQGFGTAGH